MQGRSLLRPFLLRVSSSRTSGVLHFRYNPLMDPLRELGKMLLLLGGALVILGALLYFGGRLPFRLGRLPGDIVWRGEHTTLYFPIVTCLVLSLGLSLLFWFISHFRR